MKTQRAVVLSIQNTTGNKAEKTVPTSTALTGATPFLIINQGWICKIWNDIISRIDYSWNMWHFQGHDFQGKRQTNLTNSATVATVPPIIQPTPILQSGKNNPNSIINPDNGLFTNAGYIEK